MISPHENWSPEKAAKAASDRTFGLVFTAFFAIVALQPLRRHHPVRGWAFVLSAIFCFVALVAPKALAPLNRIWTALGALLHRVTNPIILGILFYFIFTPLGWLLRRMDKSTLRLTWVKDAASYWIVREPAGPEPGTMSNQF